MLAVILIASLLFVGNLDKISAQDSCLVCGAETSIACADRNSFYVCLNDQLIPGLMVCDGDQICASNNPKRCVDPSEEKPSCINMCGECDENNFSCIDEKNFRFCFNGVVSNKGLTCPEDTVCNSKAKGFCVEPTKGSTCFSDPPTAGTTEGTTAMTTPDTTLEPTTTTEPPTTTETPPEQAVGPAFLRNFMLGKD